MQSHVNKSKKRKWIQMKSCMQIVEKNNIGPCIQLNTLRFFWSKHTEFRNQGRKDWLIWQCKYLLIGSHMPNLNNGTVHSYNNMLSARSSTDAGNMACLFIDGEKLRTSPYWSIPQVNCVSKSHCKNIAAAPIKQIQMVIIQKTWNI